MHISWNWNTRHLSPVGTPKNANSYLAQITHFQHDRKNVVTNCVQRKHLFIFLCQLYLTHIVLLTTHLLI